MADIEFGKFVEWSFLGIIGGGVSYAAIFLSKISASISELNEKVAIVLERTSFHGEQLDKHDERIRALESKRR